ncbi:MAG: chemotaxis-specific protein-glutamate methyltransferase CheB [Desulfatibacillum sp.]|nr:chemotaxis-specific protein-glutamate methyltransferase CheB [Desulfatibacillum sp.]
MIKVLVVDDSPTVREQLAAIIESDGELNLVGMAHNGIQAVEMVAKMRPDVVIMDIHMDKMDGFEATQIIMEQTPVPIVINSTLLSADHVENTFRAMQAGAVAAMEKPKGPGHPEYAQTCRKLISTVKLMSEVKVVRRSSKLRKVRPELPPSPAPLKAREKAEIKIVAVGASTGGPPVIRTILTNIRPDFHLPILFVQHISLGFLTGMVGWLNKESTLPVEIPEHGSMIKPGHVYFAPDDFHMGVMKSGKIVLSKASLENGVRPSVSFLFNSVARSHGDQAVGILLSGMGSDGSAELRDMLDKGAITIAQDEESSVVHGMPGEAIRLNGAKEIMTPMEIAAFLNSLADKK